MCTPVMLPQRMSISLYIQGTLLRIQPGQPGGIFLKIEGNGLMDLPIWMGWGGWIFGLVKLGIIFPKRSKDTFHDYQTTTFKKPKLHFELRKIF